MKEQVNGWMALVLIVALLLGYAFAFLNVKVMIPAAVAEISGQKAVITQANAAFEDINKQIAEIRAKQATLESVTATKAK